MATYEEVKNALAKLPHKEMILATCEIVREQAWKMMKDERSKRAIEAAEGFVNGTVTKDELKEAKDSAFDASATSVSAAASDAASAAYFAVSSALASSTYASTTASDAASEAAYSDAATNDDKCSKLLDRQLEIIAKYSSLPPL